MPKKTDKSISIKDATYLHVYVETLNNDLFKLLYLKWKERQIKRKNEEQTQNYFVRDLLELMATDLNLKLKTLEKELKNAN